MCPVFESRCCFSTGGNVYFSGVYFPNAFLVVLPMSLASVLIYCSYNPVVKIKAVIANPFTSLGIMR
jgi:hypothetical protein